MKKKFLVFFRGRSTDKIIEDAERLGILKYHDRIIIVSKEDDRLRVEGDLTVQQALREILSGDDDIIIIANGGTTDISIPLIAKLNYLAGHEDGRGLCECRFGNRYQILDLQFDKIKHLFGSEIIKLS